MPTYTVHAPPATKGDSAPERFVFLRDGFHFWAFVAPSLWLLAYQQWLALVIYLVVATLVVGGFVWLGVGSGALIAIGLCISLLIGLEATSIRRWTFRRRGWSNLGFVVGEDRDAAERYFFASWTERVPTQAAEPSAPNLPPRATPSSGREVIGLFPQPGAMR